MSLEEEVAKAEHEWAAAIAHRDQAVCERILGGEYTLTVGDWVGGFIPRNEWLRTLSVYVVESHAFDDLRTHVYGDVAVVKARYRQQATVAGQDRSGTFLLTDVWVKRGGRWQVVARHSSRVTATSP